MKPLTDSPQKEITSITNNEETNDSATKNIVSIKKVFCSRKQTTFLLMMQHPDRQEEQDFALLEQPT